MVHIRIARAVDSFFETAGRGISARSSTAEMAERGHQLTVYTSGSGEKSGMDSPNIDFEFMRGVSVPRWEGERRLSIPSTDELASSLEDREIDVAHVESVHFLGRKMVRACRRVGIPVVSTCHTHPGHIMPHLEPFDVGLVEDVINRYLRSFFNLCDCVIAPSDYTKSYLEGIGVEPDIHVISNGVSLDRFSPGEIGKDDREGETVLSVSRLHPDKKVDLIIEAFDHVLDERDDVTLVVVGQGAEGEKLRKLSRSLGIEESVEFTGFVEDEELPKIYREADVFVSASECENEGLTILEAMASGTPVVLSDAERNAAVDIVGDNGLLFTPGDSQDLASCVVRLLSDEEMREEFARKSVEVSENYSLDRSVDRTLELYESLIEAPQKTV